jgi:prepilin-type N-terminal cleavage/methylation domain-containing protein
MRRGIITDGEDKTMSPDKSIRAASRTLESGFTLVELVVVLALASLMLIASVPQFSGLKAGMDLRNGISQIESDLRLSQKIAAARNHQRILVFGDPDYESYTILDDLDGDRQADDGELLQVKSLPGNVSFYYLSLVPPDSIVFTPPGMLADPGDGGYITLYNCRGETRGLRIWSSGSVENVAMED